MYIIGPRPSFLYRMPECMCVSGGEGVAFPSYTTAARGTGGLNDLRDKTFHPPDMAQTNRIPSMNGRQAPTVVSQL